MPPNAELLATLLAPIPGDPPGGKDLRYDPRYGQVKEARREDLDLPAGGLATERKVADWNQVIKVATGLLATETKDLQLAAWLTEALLKRDALGGLGTGLSLLQGLIGQYWESLHPELDEEDLELRAGPLEWVGGPARGGLDIAVRQVPVAADGVTFLDYQASRTIPSEEEAEASRDKKEVRDDALAQGKLLPEDVDRSVAATPKGFYKALVADADAALAALAALEATSDERFGSDAPGFGRMRGAIDDVRRLAAAILKEKLVLDPDPVEEAAPADGVGGSGSPPGWVAGENGGGLPAEPTSAADAGARVAAVAKYLRQLDPANPAPYLMARGFRWGELRTTPGEVDPKLLEAPPTPLRARLRALLLDEKWTELLEQCEQLMVMPQGRGWLDLQRYVLTACERLGGPYDAVAAAVRAELRALLAALPRLPEMTLMDDTPTANPETRAWLAAAGLRGAPADDGADPGADDGADTDLGDGSEALDAALAQDDETAEHGGLARGGGRRRPRGAEAGRRDPFALARAELAAGRPNVAIERLVAELARERSPRGRFVRETQIAYVMVEAGLERVAQPILENLVQILDQNNRALESWEAGPLVAQPLALLCRVLDRTEGDEERRRELYERVCRLDPLQAIALQPRGA